MDSDTELPEKPVNEDSQKESQKLEAYAFAAGMLIAFGHILLYISGHGASGGPYEMGGCLFVLLAWIMLSIGVGISIVGISKFKKPYIF